MSIDCPTCGHTCAPARLVPYGRGLPPLPPPNCSHCRSDGQPLEYVKEAVRFAHARRAVPELVPDDWLDMHASGAEEAFVRHFAVADGLIFGSVEAEDALAAEIWREYRREGTASLTPA